MTLISSSFPALMEQILTDARVRYVGRPCNAGICGESGLIKS